MSNLFVAIQSIIHRRMQTRISNSWFLTKIILFVILAWHWHFLWINWNASWWVCLLFVYIIRHYYCGHRSHDFSIFIFSICCYLVLLNAFKWSKLHFERIESTAKLHCVNAKQFGKELGFLERLHHHLWASVRMWHIRLVAETLLAEDFIRCSLTISYSFTSRHSMAIIIAYVNFSSIKIAFCYCMRISYAF